MSDLLDSMTTEQMAAAMAPEDRVYVEAPPGSGKTRVLAARVVWLIQMQHVPPERIRCLTFTRAACAEIKIRVAEATSPAIANRVQIFTFHGFAADHVVPKGVRVATEAESDAAIASLYDGPMRRPRARLPGIRRLREIISELDADAAVLGTLSVHDQAARSHVITRLATSGLVPVWMVLELLDSGNVVTMPPPVEHVLVDEAQDVTPLEQHATIDHEAAHVFAVYDPLQAIMGWRGATGIAGAPDKTYRLTRTFRFGGPAFQHANRLATWITGSNPMAEHFAQPRTRISFFDDAHALAKYLGHRVYDPRQKRIAVLCRTHAECEWFTKAIDGAEVYDAAAADPLRAIHVERDPLGDPLASEADRFEEIWKDGSIVVSTIHAFKGREADIVAVCGRRWSPEPEERRVYYVACTRAKELLLLESIPEWVGDPRAQLNLDGGNRG